MVVEGATIACLSCKALLVLIVLTGSTNTAVAGESLSTDREALLQLKLFLKENNPINHGIYMQWNESDSSPCHWKGITCNTSLQRVTGINLRLSKISGKLFSNFSLLTELTDLDLSLNSIRGSIPLQINECKNVKYLNLSHNLIDGELNLTGLANLEVLDITLNRFTGGIGTNFPAICANLVILNISMNNFTGEITDCFDKCPKLMFLDLSSNKFSGDLWKGLPRLQEFSVSENNITGTITADYFPADCSLAVLDLSSNELFGKFPSSISNCSRLVLLSLSNNNFTGTVPSGLGKLTELEGLFLGSNLFNREIPDELLNCTKLVFLDLSKNNFSKEIQPIFGKFTSLKYLLLHGNGYTGGIVSSGIPRLPNVARLDLSFNRFTGELPLDITNMPRLEFLILAYNNFSGAIPPELGNISTLQALDVSFNKLTGAIPSTIGKLNSLLWLMLANNQLSGKIPPEIGNCSSLLWLNFANNQLIGSIPVEISSMGRNPEPTFQLNRRNIRIPVGSGECLSMKRWIPASYPPFSFAYTLMNRKTCRATWDNLLKGYGITMALPITGYLQLTGNQLFGDIPLELGSMKILSLLHLDQNNLTGSLPASLSKLNKLAVLNVSRNGLSGEIPKELGGLRCLQILDLSYNNFSGKLPESLNDLGELSKLNLSYNPLIYGSLPAAGQLATFDNSSFIADPLISFAAVSVNKTYNSFSTAAAAPLHHVASGRRITIWVFFALFVVLLAWILGSVAVGLGVRSKVDRERPGAGEILENIKRHSEMSFTYSKLAAATDNFSGENIIGRGGYGVVYKGVLPNGKQIAVKKLERSGSAAEREFTAEFTTNPAQQHTNIVPLLAWCKDSNSSEFILVYDYMDGGSLEDVLDDWVKFGWSKRLNAAIGVAKALVFLHEVCSPAVVHRDVKASNVLLDSYGEARLCDFGLARRESGTSTIAAGTVGYVAPEYGQSGRATTAADVYSFGVLLVELATGRRAVEEGRDESLVEWAAGKITASEVTAAVSEEGAAEMLGLMCVGLQCAAEFPKARPGIKEVFEMLVDISGDG